MTGVFTDPATAGLEVPVFTEPENYFIDDAYFKQPKAGTEIIRKPTIGEPPSNTALPENLDGIAVIKVGDKITTDHIMPAGVHLKLRSNIPAYSKVVFECFTQPGKPSFAERAAAVRDAGKAGIIIGRDSYGQGSSREHAAICPMYLGVKAVAALAIERIHRANLVNFGIIPMIFADAADYELIEEGDALFFANIREQLAKGNDLTAELCKADNSKKQISFQALLSEADRETILAGGTLNQ